MNTQSIFHLVPAGYFYTQPANEPYLPENFAVERFIHCTAGLDMLFEVANTFFADLTDDLLALEIEPQLLTVPLRFEPPIPPPGTEAGPNSGILFPHIYGPLNRTAIIGLETLVRDSANRWQLPSG